MADYPSIGGLPLAPGRDHETIGAAFEISSPAKRDLTSQFDGWTAAMIAGQAIVVVTRPAAERPHWLRAGALEAVSRILDFASFEEGVTVSLVGEYERHALWWPTRSGLVLRVFQLHTQRAGMHLSAEARTADGGLLPRQEPDPGAEWHPSLRHFRRSQASDDIHDAAMNGFFAVESLLSSAVPPKTRPDGAPAEREGVWFRRALTETEAMGYLADLAPGASDPVSVLYRDWYDDLRLPLAHAKVGRRRLTTGTHRTRASIVDNLARLLVLYERLAQRQLGVRKRHGLQFSREAVEVIAGAMLGQARAYLAQAEPSLDTDGLRLADLPATSVSLDPARPVRAIDPATFDRVYTATASDLTGPYSHFGLMSNDEVIWSSTSLLASLDPRGLCRIEVDLAIRIDNIHRVRGTYPNWTSRPG